MGHQPCQPFIAAARTYVHTAMRTVPSSKWPVLRKSRSSYTLLRLTKPIACLHAVYEEDAADTVRGIAEALLHG